ncbi:hypothetical protein [Glutamicibacter sp. TV12E]|uniref:hypothetical protein n=1 Tax=Glutamicibacter sp. TV12E TaxID=3446362 RepID=UPI0040347417
MPEKNLHPDALEAMSRVMNPPAWGMIDRYPEDELVIMTKETELSKAEKLAAAYLSALPAQPDTVTISLNSEQLDALDWLTYYGIDGMRKAVSQANEDSGESSMAWGHSMRMDARFEHATTLRNLIHGHAIQKGL